MLTKRVFLLSLTAAGFGINAPSHADETYPNRTIKLVVPFPPGTPNELVVRVIADRLSSRFSQAVVVENRPGGAGGTVGAAWVASAKPDGYTLLVSPPGPLATAAAIYKTLGYDPSTSFAPVALLFESPQLLAINVAVPAKTIEELAAYAKDKLGRINFASPGYGTQPHLLGEMFKAAAGIDIVHVPYKGPALALADLLAGQVHMYFETSPLIFPQAEAGKLRVIAVASDSRMPQLPEVPTTPQSGFPTLVGGFWSGIVAPAGTPASIVNQLNATINEIMQSREMQTHLTKLGARAKLGSPQYFASFISAERQKWSAVIKAAGVKIQ